MSHFFVLQNLLFDGETSKHRDRRLFIHAPEDTDLNENGHIRLKSGEKLDLCTFFNTFSHHKWAGLTTVRTVYLLLRGKGQTKVSISAFSENQAFIVMEDQFMLSDEEKAIELPPVKDIPGLILGVVITALSDVVLFGGHWGTSQPAPKSIRLAAVIVTYKREAQVLNSIERFGQYIIPSVPQNKLHLYVIDNGQTLAEAGKDWLSIVPNLNLGGSGGFSRGLIEAMTSDRYSHVLFMDDDAECEPESVRRTITLLDYLQDENKTVSGAMLYEDRPAIQHEKGAVCNTSSFFKPFIEALHKNMDLCVPGNLAGNETGDGEANYSGWWFFAFPLKIVKHLPFPFFVRGDDIDFGLSNKISVVTLNGIATWCDDFPYKINPQTEYLTSRSFWAVTLKHGNLPAAIRTLLNFVKWSTYCSLRFDYGTGRAVLKGITDTAKGPDLFIKNPAPATALSAIRSFTSSVAASPTQPRKEKTFKTSTALTTLLSLGGTLLPGCVRTNDSPVFSSVYKVNYRQLVYSNEQFTWSVNGYLYHKRDNRRFFKLLFLTSKTFVSLFWKIPSLLRLYKQSQGRENDLKYWQEQFSGYGADHPSSEIQL